MKRQIVAVSNRTATQLVSSGRRSSIFQAIIIAATHDYRKGLEMAKVARQWTKFAKGNTENSLSRLYTWQRLTGLAQITCHNYGAVEMMEELGMVKQ